MADKNLRSLSMVSVGETVRIVKVDAGQGLNSRLAAMGLFPNTEVTVVGNTHPGPFVVRVKGSKVMLGRGMAQKIMVCPCDHEEHHSRLSGQSE